MQDVLHREIDPEIKSTNYNTNLIDALWPGIDVNRVTGRPGDTRHLLIDTLTGFGDEHDAMDDYLFNKIIGDPRLNLTPEILAKAYNAGTQAYALTQFEHIDPTPLAGLKNFDPHAVVDGKPLLLKTLENCLNVEGNNVFIAEEIKKITSLVDVIISHPEFIHYWEIDSQLLDQMWGLAIKYEGKQEERFIRETNGNVSDTESRLTPTKERRMAEQFAHKIPPEQLVGKEGDPLLPGLVIAAHTHSLLRFVTVDTWAQTLKEVGAYEEALQRLPQSVREAGEEEFNKCLEALGEKRTQLNRNAAAGGSQSFRTRYAGPHGPKRPREGKE